MIAPHELLKELECSLSSLKNQLLTQDPAKCRYQRLSYASHNGTEFVPPSVTRELSGYEALNAGAHSYTQIFREPDQEPLSVFRACGVVLANESVLGMASSINQLKDQIKAELTGLPRRERDKVKNQYHEGLILKQVYRHVPVFFNDASVISCSWVKSGTSTAQANKASLLDLLDRIRSARISTKQSYSFIAADMDRIRAYPEDHTFKVQRATRPHARYKVKDSQGKWHDIQAHLPLIIPEGNAVEYKPLADSVEVLQLNLDKSSALIPWLGVMA